MTQMRGVLRIGVSSFLFSTFNLVHKNPGIKMDSLDYPFSGFSPNNQERTVVSYDEDKIKNIDEYILK